MKCEFKTQGGVTADLIESGIVNSKMEILDKKAFNKKSLELKEEIAKEVGLDEDVIIQEDNVAYLNSHIFDKINTDMFTPQTRRTRHTFVDKAVKERIISTIANLAPNMDIIQTDTHNIMSKYGEDYANKKGFTTPSGELILNVDNFSLDTPFHEYGHLVMRYLKKTDPDTYNAIIDKAKTTDAFLDKISRSNLNENVLAEEIFIEQVGLQSVHNFTRKQSLSKKVLDVINTWVSKIFGIDVYGISMNDSFSSIVDKFSRQIMQADSGIIHGFNDALYEGILNVKKYSKDAMLDQLAYEGYIKQIGDKLYYYDEKGNMSSIYYDRVADNEDNALDAYINYMRDFVELRFQSLDNIDDIIKQLKSDSDNIKKSLGKKKSNGYRGVTSIYDFGVDGKGGFMSEEDRAKMYRDRALKRIKSIAYEETKSSLTSTNTKNAKYNKKEKDSSKHKKIYTKTEIELLADEAGIEAIKNASGSHISYTIDKLKGEDNFSRSNGLITHKLYEEYLEYRKALKNDRFINVKTRDGKGNIIIKKISPRNPEAILELKEAMSMRGMEITEVRNGIKTTVVKDGTPEFPGPWEYQRIRDSRKNLLDEYEKVLIGIESSYKGRNIEFLPEVAYRDDVLKVTGIIDLLVIDKSTGEAIPFDFKTKDKKSFRNWDYAGARPLENENFSEFKDTAATRTAVQLGIYRLSLANKGFKTNNTPKVIYIEGDIIYGQGQVNREYTQYSEPKIRVLDVIDTRSNLLEEYKSKGFKVDLLDYANKDDIHESLINISEGDSEMDSYDISDEIIDEIYNNSVIDENGNLIEYYKANGDSFYGFTYKRRGSDNPYQLKATTEKAIKKEIKSIINNRTLLNQKEAAVEKIFNYEGTDRPPGVKAEEFIDLKYILGPFTKETHELVRFSKDPRFGKNYTGIIAFKNKLSGEYTFLVLQNFYHTSDKRNESPKDKLLFSKYMSANEVGSLLKSDANTLERDPLNFRFYKAVAMMAKLKKIDPDFSVDYMYASKPLMEGLGAQDPIIYEKTELIENAKLLFQLAKDKGEIKPELENLLEDETLWQFGTYSTDFVSKTFLMLKEIDSTLDFDSITRTTAIEELENFMNDPAYDINKVIGALQTYLDKNKRYSKHETRVIGRTILHLHRLETAFISQDVGELRKYFSIPSHSENTYVGQMNRVARENRERSRFEFMEHRAEHASQLKKFGITRSKRLSSKTSKFTDLIHVDPKDPEGSYKFKPEALDLEYVKYWQETVKEALKSTATSDKQKANIDAYIDAGYIPLIPDSWTIGLEAVTDSKSYMEAVRSNLNNRRSQAKENKADLYLFKNVFLGEVNRTDEVRARKMGAENGEFTKKFETNLETILDLVVSESSSVKYGRTTLSVAKNLASELSYQGKNFKHEATNVDELLELVSRIYVKGEFRVNTDSKKALNTLIRSVSVSTISFSPPSIALEFVTNSLNIGRLMVQEGVMNKFFGVRSKFTPTDVMKATELIAKDKAKADLMMHYFGIMESDPTRMQAMLSSSVGKNLLKSETLYGPQHAILRYAMLTIMVASLVGNGSYEAYSVVDGKLHYEPKKDRQYFDSNGDFYDTKYNTAEENEARWKYVEERLRSEGKMREDGTYISGMPTNEIIKLKDYMVGIFSSMDGDSKGLISQWYFMRMLMQFKTWVVPIIDRAIGSPNAKRENKRRYEYVRNSKGELIAVEIMTPAEGYLYTLWTIMKRVPDPNSPAFVTGKWGMTEFEREQMSALATDLMMVAAVSGMVSLLKCPKGAKSEDCWYKKSYSGDLTYSTLKKSIGDLFTPWILFDMASGNASIIPMFGIIKNIMGRVTSSITLTAEGNVDSAFVELTSIINAFKHGYKMFDVKVNKDGILGVGE